MGTVLYEWLAFAARWLHIVTAIAWIGSSFYFIALDLGLRKRPGLPQGVGGEAWQVHGGGFYHVQKYMVAPPHMPDDLTWFKWESYWTWISGFLLLVIVYWFGAELFLIDHERPIPVWVAILISFGSLVIGWLVYDRLCKSPLGRNDTALFAVLFILLTLAGWAYTQVYSGRGAMLHLGALIATIMTANVAHLIIPNQRIVVADLKAGRSPDPALGEAAKQRSLHNNYLTLPVIFLMLSNHYPLATSTEFNWAIAALVLLIGALVRHFFNTMHASGEKPWWTWGAAAALFLVAALLSTVPGGNDRAAEARSPVDDPELALAASPHFIDAQNVVLSRCSMCHAAEPLWEGIAHPPKDVRLEDEASILAQAREINVQAVRSRAMPPGNVTGMTEEERATLALWLESARP